MKKITAGIIFLAGFLIAVSPGICKTENLVYNGGFEHKKTEKLPSGWLMLKKSLSLDTAGPAAK